MAWRRWPFITIGFVILWLAIAFAVNSAPSGAIFGAAAGSTTFRDPPFLLAEFVAGLLVKRWWHLTIAAVLISVVYTISLNGALITDVDGAIRLMPFIGRALSVIVVCSLLAIAVDLFKNFSNYVDRSENP